MNLQHPTFTSVTRIIPQYRITCMIVTGIPNQHLTQSQQVECLKLHRPCPDVRLHLPLPSLSPVSCARWSSQQGCFVGENSSAPSCILMPCRLNRRGNGTPTSVLAKYYQGADWNKRFYIYSPELTYLCRIRYRQLHIQVDSVRKLNYISKISIIQSRITIVVCYNPAYTLRLSTKVAMSNRKRTISRGVVLIYESRSGMQY